SPSWDTVSRSSSSIETCWQLPVSPICQQVQARETRAHFALRSFSVSPDRWDRAMGLAYYCVKTENLIDDPWIDTFSSDLGNSLNGGQKSLQPFGRQRIGHNETTGCDSQFVGYAVNR